MKQQYFSWIGRTRGAFCAIVLMGMAFITSAKAQTTYAYFPTGATNDGRFLSIASSNLQTLAGEITLSFGSPSMTDTMEIGIFDGNTGGQWDQGTVPLEFTIFADSTGNGTSDVQVGTWLGSSMPDNAWYTIRFANVTSARAANGNYFYTLRVRTTNPAVTHWSNFKVRTNGTVTLKGGQSFSVTAALFVLADGQAVYPLYPVLTPTNYDGSWDFYLDVPVATSFLTVWDGDMDYGDCNAKDTDDPDTPNDGVPSFAIGTPAVPEGIARGTTNCAGGGVATGAPTDDAASLALRRSPAVQYEVIDPNGNRYMNYNPSGNMEWEQFRISTDAFDSTQMDYHANSLPAGTYKIHMTGMDMANLNAWRFYNDAGGTFANEAMGVTMQGAPVPPLRAHGVAGAVYADNNGNGVQDAGEASLMGVRVNLRFDVNNDNVVDQTFTVLTDSSGRYAFSNLSNGAGTIRVDTTTTVEYQPVSDYDGVATPNVAAFSVGPSASDPTVNFGYVQLHPHTVSGTLYVDQNSNGAKDLSESGLVNIGVSLIVDRNGDGNSDTTLTTHTDSSGRYSFANLYAGSYVIVIDTTTLPVGYKISSGLDSGSWTSATLTIYRGDADASINIGVAPPPSNAEVTGVLYVDANGNGAADASEQKLSSVGVTLKLDVNNDGTADSTWRAVSGADGSFRFSGLPAGSTTVAIDTAGLVELTGSAGSSSTFSLSSGQKVNNKNFAFRRTHNHAINGVIYCDANGNGVKDAGEVALSGVTIRVGVDANSDGVIDSTLTLTSNISGQYSCSSLYSGVYRIAIDTTSIREVSPMSDPDGVSTPNTATVTIAVGASDPTSNFAYRRLCPHAVSGVVYYDGNQNTGFDAGETGIPSVTVRLDLDYNSDGVVDSTRTTVTGDNGTYSFASLMAGTYTVRIDAGTIAEDLIPTVDPDGISTVNTATRTVTAGQSDAPFSFGYVRANPLGTGTRGYWVNHPAAWPVSSLSLGGSLYSKSELLQILERATKGDMTYAMAAQLIAAKLNVASGNPSSCIVSTIVAADAWLAQYPVGSKVSAGSAAWLVGNPIHNTLDSYNNGNMCASHLN